MMELLMKFTNIHPSAHYQHASTQMAQQPATRSITTVLLHLGSSSCPHHNLAHPNWQLLKRVISLTLIIHHHQALVGVK